MKKVAYWFTVWLLWFAYIFLRQEGNWMHVYGPLWDMGAYELHAGLLVEAVGALACTVMLMVFVATITPDRKL